MNDKEQVLAFIKKKLNNVEFEVLEYKDDGKSIQVKVTTGGDGEIYLWVNRRKAGYRLVSVG